MVVCEAFRGIRVVAIGSGELVNSRCGSLPFEEVARKWCVSSSSAVSGVSARRPPRPASLSEVADRQLELDASDAAVDGS